MMAPSCAAPRHRQDERLAADFCRIHSPAHGQLPFGKAVIPVANSGVGLVRTV